MSGRGSLGLRAVSMKTWRGTTITGFTRGIEVLLTYGFYLLLARTTSAREVGLFAAAVALLQLSSVAAKRGLDQAVLANAPSGAVNRLVMGIAMTNAVALAVAAYIGAMWVSNDGVLAPLVLVLPVVTAVQLTVEMLRTRGAVETAALAENVVQPLAAVVFALVAVASGATVWRFAAAYALSWAVSLPFIAKVEWHDAEPLPAERRAEILTTARSMLGVQLFQAMASLDVLVIAAMAGAVDTGIYSISYKIAAGFLLLHGAVSAASTPAIRAHVLQRDDLTSLFGFVTRWGTAAAAIAASIIVVMPELLLSLFGADYAARGTAPLLILTVAFATYVCSGPAGSILLCAGLARRLFLVTASGTAVTFIALLFLARHGAVGAAAAVCIGSIATRVALVASIRELVSPKLFVRNVALVAAATSMARVFRLMSAPISSVLALLTAIALAMLFLHLHGDLRLLRGSRLHPAEGSEA